MSTFTNAADGAAEEAAAYVDAVLGLLGDRDPLAVLRATAGELRAAVGGVPDAVLRRPEAAGRWSVGEVLAHLADSELVWAVRLRMVLGQERPALAGYDQDAWARRMRYADVDPRRSLERFAGVREWNLSLAGRLPDTELDRVGLHGERGEESVRHMIRLYAGHDLVHLAQVRRILSAAEGSGDDE